jgi:hypothetical protein
LSAGGTVQVVPREVEVPWTEADLRGAGQAEVEEVMRREWLHRFDLA